MRKSLGMSLLIVGALSLAAGPAAAGGGAHPMLVEMNETLAAMGMDVRVAYAEYITSGEGGEAGQTIYANNRGNKQLGSDWVPGDPNRDGRTDITWIVDAADSCLDVSLPDMLGAIDRAMGTWQEVICSEIPLTGLGAYNFDFGYVQYLFGQGGIPGWAADITHAGWLPGSFFDLIGGPGASASILGVTFTFVWIDPATGDPTDIDGNGKTDVAFREIYYNDAFAWNIGSTYDIETVVLHETGHGLSQAHFGKIFQDAGAGGLHFSPRAVMNAAYSGVQQELTGTDVGGHCSNWGSWPND